MLSFFQILNLVAVNCTDHRDIKKLEATILEHVKNEELFPEVVRVLPPVYRQVEAAIVDIAQGEELADHGEWSMTPTTPSWEDLLSYGWTGSPVFPAPSGPIHVVVGSLLKTLQCYCWSINCYYPVLSLRASASKAGT